VQDLPRVANPIDIQKRAPHRIARLLYDDNEDEDEDEDEDDEDDDGGDGGDDDDDDDDDDDGDGLTVKTIIKIISTTAYSINAHCHFSILLRLNFYPDAFNKRGNKMKNEPHTFYNTSSGILNISLIIFFSEYLEVMHVGMVRDFSLD
jgi:hypothetical protein